MLRVWVFRSCQLLQGAEALLFRRLQLAVEVSILSLDCLLIMHPDAANDKRIPRLESSMNANIALEVFLDILE